MKKINLLLLLFISIVSNAQIGLYRVNVSGVGYHRDHADFGELKINLNFNNGSSSQIIYVNYHEGDLFGINNNNSFTFTASKKISSIYYWAHRDWSNCGICSNESAYADRYSYPAYPYNCTIFNSSYFGNYTFGNAMWSDYISITSKPELTLIQNGENSLPIEDSVTINSHTGFATNEYNWQYKLIDPDNPMNVWTDLPLFNGQSSITTNAVTILGSSASNHHGKTIQFKQKACDVNSNVINHTIRLSAPHITNKIETPVSCFDSQDGKIKIYFNRFPQGCVLCRQTNPIPDEDLNYTLINTDTNTPVGIPPGNPTSINFPGQPIVVMQGDKSFEISGLYPGNYTFQLFGYYDNSNTYVGGLNHKVNFTILKPNPVSFTTSKTDVWCNSGNDGTIIINASGGTTVGSNTYQYSLNNGAWMPFTNGNSHTITGKSIGTYNIKVRDAKACVAKVQTLVNGVINLGVEKQNTETISQPNSPVAINYTLVQQPTFSGGSNGKIVAAITGGTIFTNNTYDFIWKNSAGITQTNTTTTFTGGNTFSVTLNNVPSDTYTLTIKDKNFNSATQQGGCSILNSSQFLGQPEPIMVTFEALPPKCNVTNQFGNETDLNPADGQRDESQNGMITATITGGSPYTVTANGGKPYKYFWKKQLSNGSWQPITNESNILPNVGQGNYALNVEDSKQIRLGTYVNNVLVTEIDKTTFVQQPDKLELSFTKVDVSCGNTSNGSARAIVSGGKPPYKYEWTNTTANTNNISGLNSGNYFVRIIDNNGCIVQGSVNLPQPGNVTITDVSSNPSCHLGSDGSIDLRIIGGILPFSYAWSNNATSQDLTNVPAGTYSVIVTDGSGCQFTHEVILIDPNPITINLGPDRTLCNNQSHDLNIAITDPNAQYSWTSTNGFTSNKPNVSLTQAGTYHAKVTTSLGCKGEDDITIQTSQINIQSEFFLTSQAYLDEEVVLVNTSNPFGENTEWVIPSGVTIVNQQSKFIVLKFNTIGTKTISLKQTQGDCYALYSKNINVEDRSSSPNPSNTNSPFIKDFIVTPNPSNGQFSAIVNLQQINPIKLRLYSYSGQTAIIQKSEAGQKNYVVDFNLSLASGTYVLVLETSQQTLIRKIIIF
jgi:hypothetical protein